MFRLHAKLYRDGNGPAETPDMRTYRELFRTPEFTPLFSASCAQVAATTLAGLALATLVYARTESPLLSALSMFGSSFAGLIGATTLLSLADRMPPRVALTLVALTAALAGLLLATPGLPLSAMFAVILAQGLQVAGFALGGLLIAVVSPRTTLLAGAALAACAALVLRFGLRARPPRASGRPSIAVTWRVNRELLSTRARRAVYLSMWCPTAWWSDVRRCSFRMRRRLRPRCSSRRRWACCSATWRPGGSCRRVYGSGSSHC
jgi:hypothetical protein